MGDKKFTKILENTVSKKKNYIVFKLYYLMYQRIIL